MSSALCLTENAAQLQAQYLVCQHLVAACHHGMYEIALEEDREPEVRREAIRILKVIHADWIQTRRELRRQVSDKQRSTYSPSKGVPNDTARS